MLARISFVALSLLALAVPAHARGALESRIRASAAQAGLMKRLENPMVEVALKGGIASAKISTVGGPVYRATFKVKTGPLGALRVRGIHDRYELGGKKIVMPIWGRAFGETGK
jgi:hypothetical protein